MSLLVLALGACQTPGSDATRATAEIASLIESEEWISRQTNLMPKLNESIKNLRLPDEGARLLFAHDATLQGLAAGSRSADYDLPALGVSAYNWPLASEPGNNLWKPFLDKVSFFENAKFAIVRARFVNPTRTQVSADIHFAGLARGLDGTTLQIEADQEVLWRLGDAHWQIVGWRQNSFSIVAASRPIFSDVVGQVLPEGLRESVQHSSFQQMLCRLKDEPPRYFSARSADRHPCVAIVDIDRDGFDDFYLMDRLDTNLFFRNRGDGTFEEIGRELGLDLAQDCSSAIFADFDNDGDSDLFLGRTLQRSLYLVNENGRFVDRTKEMVSHPLPYLVFSISAADYNGDGLLDVFLATYAQETQDISVPDDTNKTWLAEFLSPEQARHMYDLRLKDGMLDMPGPPNLLLVNEGDGRFALSPLNSQLEEWRQTTQGTWSDFDDDGDVDIYLANDFGPNRMFRNDDGKTFVDITEQTGTADLGFGMGVSWGDFDLDGRQDLYVSNMFSKAGQRVTAQTESLGVDPRVSRMSGGNTLFQNQGDYQFKKVSGLKPPALCVEKAGWSYSGQFADIDNNGYLDIYALAGFYTAPPEHALPIDL